MQKSYKKLLKKEKKSQKKSCAKLQKNFRGKMEKLQSFETKGLDKKVWKKL
jgi:hypothetical protein